MNRTEYGNELENLASFSECRKFGDGLFFRVLCDWDNKTWREGKIGTAFLRKINHLKKNITRFTWEIRGYIRVYGGSLTRDGLLNYEIGFSAKLGEERAKGGFSLRRKSQYTRHLREWYTRMRARDPYFIQFFSFFSAKYNSSKKEAENWIYNVENTIREKGEKKDNRLTMPRRAVFYAWNNRYLAPLSCPLIWSFGRE